jgi:hypothetical protein
MAQAQRQAPVLLQVPGLQQVLPPGLLREQTVYGRRPQILQLYRRWT